ncbi:MAG: 1,4-alpha-glucan branching protein GlgB [Ruminococcus sp.]|nr:1,4-alpha-glucan branching protein GlgB [Ruminococcus sp.]
MDETAVYLFNHGENAYAYRALGAHERNTGGIRYWEFSVFAPNAVRISVVGDFNNWKQGANPMEKFGETGCWSCRIAEAGKGDRYKFAITGRDGQTVLKSDPFAFRSELRPGTASVLHGIPRNVWTDGEYLKLRAQRNLFTEPINIYEVHAGSWKQGMNYSELGRELVDYCVRMGYTHIELLPLAEHPLDDSWGYQVTGYYAVTARYGAPEQLAELVDYAHKCGIGVIMDWVPAHFPRDAYALARFDGTPLFEHPDSRLGEHKEWGTYVFNWSKAEIHSFLISNAVFWFDEFHMDGLRVDAVSSMLYLDYNRKDGEWVANKYGGNENLDAVDFLQKLNIAVFERFPNALMIAEESTAWAGVTKPVYEGGLGFNFKWNMGWMNDTLSYVETDSYFRSGCHHKMTFSIVYAFGESYILPISHDEVVHGKKSLIDKMFGPYENKFPQLRTYLAFMMAHPGKKLLFMGCEFAQFREWDFENSLEWFMLDYPKHKETQDYVRALNHFYLSHPALWERDRDYGGFRWLDADRCGDNTYIFERYDLKGNRVVCVFNFSPNEYRSYGIPAEKGAYTEIFNTDKPCYGGSGCDNPTRLTAKKAENGGFFLKINVPAFGACFFRYTKPRTSNKKQEGIKGHD